MRSISLAIAFAAAMAAPIRTQADDPPYVSAASGSVGYLHPLGVSTDIGYTFGRYVSVGLNLMLPNTFWSDPMSMAGGYTVRFFEPFSDMESARFFLSVHHLASFFPATKTFEYVGAKVGCVIFLYEQLALRPEIG